VTTSFGGSVDFGWARLEERRCRREDNEVHDEVGKKHSENDVDLCFSQLFPRRTSPLEQATPGYDF